MAIYVKMNEYLSAWNIKYHALRFKYRMIGYSSTQIKLLAQI